MIYNRFTFAVILLSVLLGLTGLALIWISLHDYLMITKISIGLVWVFILVFLIYYVRRTNRELIRFLENLRYLDTIKNVNEKDPSFRRLNKAFNRVIDKIRHVRSEHAAEHQYFQSTVEHIPVGLMAFRDDGKVDFVNKAAKELLHIHSPKHFRDLNTVYEKLGDKLFYLTPGRNELFKVQINSKLLHLSIRSVLLKIKNMSIKLVSIQNIQSELEEGELEAWQKLISVMTHEIMNSVSPLKSLTFSMQKILKNQLERAKSQHADEGELNKVLSGLNAVEKRSRGLLNFVQSYKDLTTLPFPNFEIFRVMDLFREVKQLIGEELYKESVTLKIHPIEGELTIKADYNLISQVLINLIQNAIFALSERERKVIELTAYKNKDEYVIIQVLDNGKGIPQDEVDKIFIPFYSTREKGSGIGLSFARQVMQLHRGRIYVQSKEGMGTTFSLVL
jgi:signal transduction histidine kinase